MKSSLCRCYIDDSLCNLVFEDVIADAYSCNFVYAAFKLLPSYVKLSVQIKATVLEVSLVQM